MDVIFRILINFATTNPKEMGTELLEYTVMRKSWKYLVWKIGGTNPDQKTGCYIKINMFEQYLLYLSLQIF